jgi:hypothetical protein
MRVCVVKCLECIGKLQMTLLIRQLLRFNAVGVGEKRERARERRSSWSQLITTCLQRSFIVCST